MALKRFALCPALSPKLFEVVEQDSDVKMTGQTLNHCSYNLKLVVADCALLQDQII